MDEGIKSLLLRRIDAAEKRLAHVPYIVSNNKRMAIWSDIKEALFLWCASQQCTAVLNALKHQLGYPASEEVMHPCTQLEQLMFLKQFVVVSPGTLLVDLSQLSNSSALMLLYDVVKMKHNHSRDPGIKKCNESMAKLTENFSNSSIKIPLSNLVRKKFIPAVRRISKSTASLDVPGTVIPPDRNMTGSKRNLKLRICNQSDKQDGQTQVTEGKKFQTGGPVISSVVYNAGDREATEAMVPLSILREMFPFCQSYLEQVVHQFVLGRCDKEYLRSVRKCSFEEGIQLTRFLACQNGYVRSWSCLTTCSVLISWADFWFGHMAFNDSIKLLPQSREVSVVILSCQELWNAVPSVSPQKQPHMQKNVTFNEADSKGRSQNKVPGGLIKKTLQSSPVYTYTLMDSQGQCRTGMNNSQQAYNRHLNKDKPELTGKITAGGKVKAMVNNASTVEDTNSSVKVAQSTLQDEPQDSGKLKSTDDNSTETLTRSNGSSVSVKPVRENKKGKQDDQKLNCKEKKRRNATAIKGTSRTFVRVTRSSVNVCRAETDPHEIHKGSRAKSRKQARRDKDNSQTAEANSNEMQSKKHKKDSNNSAVYDDANVDKEGSGDTNGRQVPRKIIIQASNGCIKNEIEDTGNERKVMENASTVLIKNKDVLENGKEDSFKDRYLKDIKHEDEEKNEDENTETETYSMEVSIIPKKNKEIEETKMFGQNEENKTPSLLHLTNIGKKRGGFSLNYPDRAVLRISPAKINDNIPPKLRVKKESTPRSQSAGSNHEKNDYYKSDVDNVLAEFNCNDKPKSATYTPKYVSIIPKQLQLKTPAINQPKKQVFTEKFPYKNVRSQAESAQNEIKVDQNSRTSQSMSPPSTPDPIYPVIQGSAFENLKSRKPVPTTTVSANLPGPLNPILSNSNSTAASPKLPDEIVKNLKENASKSICSIRGNSDAKMLEEIHAEGKIIQKADCEDTDMSNFQTQRMSMWKEKVGSPEKWVLGRVCKSADVIHRTERTYTYRPSSSIYSHTLDKTGRTTLGPSIKKALYAIYSRDKSESPEKTVAKSVEKEVPVAKIVPAKKTKVNHVENIEYGCSSSKTPDIYDKFARKRRPRGAMKSDASPMKAKIVGQTVVKPVQASKPKTVDVNNVQSVKEVQPVTNATTNGHMQKSKPEQLPQNVDPVQQRYSHVVDPSLANLPYTSMINSFCCPSEQILPVKYPSCIMCRQSMHENSNVRNLDACISQNSSDQSLFQSSTHSSMKIGDAQSTYSDTPSNTSQQLHTASKDLVVDKSKPMSLLQKVDSFVDNYVSPQISESLENVENLKALMNFNFLPDDQASKQKGTESIKEACQTNIYPFRHCKECSRNDGTLQNGKAAEALGEMLTEAGEVIARVNSQLYFSTPDNGNLFKVSGAVTIPANAQFYVQTKLGEYKEAIPNTPSVPTIQRPFKAIEQNHKETDNQLDVKTVEETFLEERYQHKQVSKSFKDNSCKNAGEANNAESQFEIIGREDETNRQLKDIENRNKWEEFEDADSKFQEETMVGSEMFSGKSSKLDSEKVDCTRLIDTISPVKDEINPSSITVSTNNELYHAHSEAAIEKEIFNELVNENMKSTNQSVKEDCNSEASQHEVESYRNITPSPVKKSKPQKPDRSFLEYVEETRAAKKKEEEELRKKKFWASAQVQYLKSCQAAHTNKHSKKVIKPGPKTSSKAVIKTLKENPVDASHKAKNLNSTSTTGSTYQRPKTTSGPKIKPNLQQKSRPKTVPSNKTGKELADETKGCQKVSPIKNDCLNKQHSGRRIYPRYGAGKNMIRPKTSHSMISERKALHMPSRTAKSAKLNTESQNRVRERERKVSDDAYQAASTLRRLSIENNFGISDKKYEARRSKLHSFLRAEFDKVKAQEMQISSDAETPCISNDSKHINAHVEQGDQLMSSETVNQSKHKVAKYEREAFITQSNPRFIMDGSFSSQDVCNKTMSSDKCILQNERNRGPVYTADVNLNSNENNKTMSDDVLAAAISHTDIPQNTSTHDAVFHNMEAVHNSDSSDNSSNNGVNLVAPVHSSEDFHLTCQYNIPNAQCFSSVQVLDSNSQNVLPDSNETSSVPSDNEESLGTTISIQTLMPDEEDMCLKVTSPDGTEYTIPRTHPSYITLSAFFQDQQLENVIMEDQVHSKLTSGEVQDTGSVTHEACDIVAENQLNASDSNFDGVINSDNGCVVTYITQDTANFDGTDGAQYIYTLDKFETKLATVSDAESTYSEDDPPSEEEQLIVTMNNDIGTLEECVDNVDNVYDNTGLRISENSGTSTQNKEFVYEWVSHTEDIHIDNNPQNFDVPELTTEDVTEPHEPFLIPCSSNLEYSEYFTDLKDNAYEIAVYSDSKQDEEFEGSRLQTVEHDDDRELAVTGDTYCMSDRCSEEQDCRVETEESSDTDESQSMTDFDTNQAVKSVEYLNVKIDTRRGTHETNSRNITLPFGYTQHSSRFPAIKKDNCKKDMLISSNVVEEDLNLAAETEIIESTGIIGAVALEDIQQSTGENVKPSENGSDLNSSNEYVEVNYDSDDEYDSEIDVDDVKDVDYIPDETDEEDLGDIYDDVMKINKSLGKEDVLSKSKSSKFKRSLHFSNPKASLKKSKIKTKSKSKYKDTDTEEELPSIPGSRTKLCSKRYEKAKLDPTKNNYSDESESDYLEGDRCQYVKTKHPKSKVTKNKSKQTRKNRNGCQTEVDTKRKERKSAKAAEGFIKTQKIYFDIIKNSSLNNSSVEADTKRSDQGSGLLDNVPSGIPVCGERVITKAMADAEKALEGTGSLSDDSEAPQVIDDLANNCRYQLVEDEDHINLGGIAYFGDFALPFVYINGYKYTPLKDALALFQPGHCVSKCTIPRNVLQKHKQVMKTFSTWDHVYKFELIKMKKGPPIKTGDMVVKLDSLFNTLPELIREIVRQHRNTKLKRSQLCNMTSYKNFKMS